MDIEISINDCKDYKEFMQDILFTLECNKDGYEEVYNFWYDEFHGLKRFCKHLSAIAKSMRFYNMDKVIVYSNISYNYYRQQLIIHLTRR